MRLRALILPTLTIVAFAGACSGNGDNDEPILAPPRDERSPTPTAAPGTPTAVPAGPPPQLRLEVAFSGIGEVERPVEMVEVPGRDSMLLALQDGRVLSFPRSGSGAATALDIRGKTSRDNNEEGLLGLALDPAFDQNRLAYLYYSVRPGERRTILSRFTARIEGGSVVLDPASELVLLEVPQPFGNHKGGKVAFGPDGMLYLGLGDGGSGGDPRGNGQDLKHNLLGSIIRIDVRGATASKPYSIPPDNPFAASADGARPETWAYGLRNPWRFSFDRATGALWAGDVGQNEWEEIDLITKGGNYGWNIVEGPDCYAPKSGCNRAGLLAPVVSYANPADGCSVTGGFVYRGKAVPALVGWYVYGDFCTGTIWALDPTAAAAGRDPQVQVVMRDGPPIASFAEDLAGELYLLAFDDRIYRVLARD